jgi:hypothetical protein
MPRFIASGSALVATAILATGSTLAVEVQGDGGGDRRWSLQGGVYEGYNSNVDTTNSDPIGSWYTELAAGAQYRGGNSRTTVEAEIGAGLSFYYDAPDGSSFYPNIDAGLEVEHSATSRLDLRLSSTTAYLSQPSYNIPGASVNQGDYWVSSTTVEATFQWKPKVSLVTAWQVDAYLYADGYTQDSLGRIEQTGSQQVLFLWKPTTALVGEYRINPRTFLYNPEMDNIGQFFLLGADHTFTPKMEGYFRAGVEQRWLNEPDGGQGTYLGPYGEIGFTGNLSKTKLDFFGRYGTQSSGIIGVGESDTLMFGMAAERKITSRVSFSAFVNYQNNQFNQQNTGPNFSDNVLDAGCGLSYRLSRRVALQGGYRYSTLLSDESYREYNRTILFLGTEVNF